MTTDTSAPLSAPTKTAEEMTLIYAEMDALIEQCAPSSNRHDLAIVLIAFCIENSIDTGPQIIGTLKTRDFKPSHIGKWLSVGRGSNPVRHFWERDAAGRYRNLM